MQTRENKGQTKLPFSQSQDKDNNKESLARQSHIKNCQIAAVAAKVRRLCVMGQQLLTGPLEQTGTIGIRPI